ncbi:uncharacterized protein EV154DRAFT_488928, partial [Mucor mucedo]|uniref:uncharacterized protein n=1 Tax=Mucor mucedo TaxID=29922 RepID=UPI00221F42C5
PLRCYSARSLERSIGSYKTRIRSTVHPGVNAGNILETRAIFKFLKIANIFDFFALTATIDKETNFVQHPSNDPLLPQLRSPFLNCPYSSMVVGDLLEHGRSSSSFDNRYRIMPWIFALMNCLARVTGIRQTTISAFHLNQQLVISSKLFSNNHVYVSDLYKSKNRSSTRGGDFVMFEAVHKSGSSYRVTNRYVWGEGSHYVYRELTKTNGVSPLSKSIPRVQMFDRGQEKFVVFDARDIVSSIGLLNSADGSSYKYVIRTGDAFKPDMKTTAGKISALE